MFLFMTALQGFVIIKGQPKTLQIDKIELCANGVYAVKYKNSPSIFHYRNNDVIWLTNATWHYPLHNKVYINGQAQRNVTDILSFKQQDLTHWRITYTNGYIQDYLHGTIQVVESCLADNIACNAFDYLKRISQVNDLGKDEEHGGILPSLYAKIDFIDKSLAIAPYLDAKKYKQEFKSASNIIYPFGCNASQANAVKAAMVQQISVIQGPPGTGKTQTILNIIANILMRNQTVMVVSNNNSATLNVMEKLQKYGLGFIVASLGKRENKENFIKNQPSIPQELNSWALKKNDKTKIIDSTSATLSKLRDVFSLQEELANCKQELKAIELEWQHFKSDNKIKENDYKPKSGVKSNRLMDLWLQYQEFNDSISIKSSYFRELFQRIKLTGLSFIGKYLLGIKASLYSDTMHNVLVELQSLYLIAKQKELSNRITEIEAALSSTNAKSLSNHLSELSMALLKNKLHEKYENIQHLSLNEVKDIHRNPEEFCKNYPVILSTTFSARTTIPDQIYDYIIMDEASQVSIETGALALTCARNAVIVGDTMQLPNVVTDEDKIKLDGIFKEYKVANGYNCAKYSFLQSICTIIPDVTQTLLREHYRCHPTIINYCNQRFYGGNLLIMTEDHHEKNVMITIKTAHGHHAYNHYNQREIDVIKNEVLPLYNENDDIGIITPYNNQVDEFMHQLPNIETATIHKYQGREKDNIIMSVVDDQITEFSDDTNMINVAISRAKKQFVLVVSGNEQERKGNISDLIEYIQYNNMTVTDSKISSIFDYLYSHYTSERMRFLEGHKKISEYDSENLTYSLIESIISEHPEYKHLRVLCHTPLRTVIRDWSLLNDEETKYISNYCTHLDFLIINHVTKKPILAIETDGYTYHNIDTEQHRRDKLKNHILEIYDLPLLRLRTNESGEKEKIIKLLKSIVQIYFD